MSFQILGTGAYVPEKILTNEELSQMVDTSDEWITQRVGVKTRHISVNESAAEMGAKAAQRALEAAGISAAQLGLIVGATVSADQCCPSTAAKVQQAIGASCPAFDVNSACSGFLFALDTAAAFIVRGGIEYALVFGAERLSRILDWTDRSTCVIFGDGAGAFVIAKGENYLGSHLFTQGGESVLAIPLGKGNSPFYEKEVAPLAVHMSGQETFKFAVKQIVGGIRLIAEQAGITTDQINWIVPHQANIRIIDLAARRLGIPMEKFVVNIERYGNTSSASVPISFDELARSGKLKKGDLIAMCAFGGGLSSAACLIKW
ncbi:MAG: ketoacyl-ACP synthase III [Oscillospiraceae bacterium]|nr:ketoacyl-ACP synthase III [Oscillospiraceae bacterium]